MSSPRLEKRNKVKTQPIPQPEAVKKKDHVVVAVAKAIAKHIYDTVYDARFMTPTHEKDASYTPPKNCDPGHWGAPETAFYVGKFIEKETSIYMIPVNSFGFSLDETKVYNRDFFSALLYNAFQHTKPGQKVLIYTCRKFSEMFNGNIDVMHAMSDQQMAGMIRGIALRLFPERVHDLIIMPIDQVERHAVLFTQLKRCANPRTGFVNLEKAYGTPTKPELSAKPNSLEIAQLFYWIAKQPGSKLYDKFAKTRTKKLKKINRPGGIGYALTEAAIRMADLDQHKIQGGVTLQAKYDEFNIRVTKGKPKDGDFKSMNDLDPLYTVFKGKPFGTIHIDSHNNYYALKERQRRAKTRFFIYTQTLIFIAAFAVHFIHTNYFDTHPHFHTQSTDIAPTCDTDDTEMYFDPQTTDSTTSSTSTENSGETQTTTLE